MTTIKEIENVVEEILTIFTNSESEDACRKSLIEALTTHHTATITAIKDAVMKSKDLTGMDKAVVNVILDDLLDTNLEV